jgi:hypothetical protein
MERLLVTLAASSAMILAMAAGVREWEGDGGQGSCGSGGSRRARVLGNLPRRMQGLRLTSFAN